MKYYSLRIPLPFALKRIVLIFFFAGYKNSCGNQLSRELVVRVINHCQVKSAVIISNTKF